MRFTRFAVLAVLLAASVAPARSLTPQNQTSTTSSDDGTGSYMVTDPAHSHISGWTSTCGSFSRWNLINQYYSACALDYCAQIFFTNQVICTGLDSGPLSPSNKELCCSDRVDQLVSCLNNHQSGC